MTRTTSNQLVFTVPTDKQVDDIFADLTLMGDVHAYHAALFAANGFRRGEFIQLQWADLDFDKGTIMVAGSGSSRRRAVPMTDKVRRELRGVCPPENRGTYVLLPGYSRHAAAATLGRGLRNSARRLSVKITFGHLRRKYATDLVSTGVSVCQLTRALGHSCWRRADCLLEYCHVR